MEQETKKRSRKKKVAATVAVVMAIAITLGGTYMYTNFDQHKTNVMRNSLAPHDATLVENFVEKDDWTIADGAVKKEVSVVNPGKAADGYEEVYVRIQLKEYFEIQSLITDQTSERYMVDPTTGEFIHYATAQEANAAYENHTAVELTDALTGITAYYVQTKAGDDDGQYGKFIYTQYELNTSVTHVIGDVRADSIGPVDHQAKPNGECAYPIHFWDDTTDLSQVYAQDYQNTSNIDGSDYIQWLLGTDDDGNSNAVLLSRWDGKPVAKWIIDDTADNDNPWIYWGELLQPEEKTSNFLDAIKLIKQPDGEFYYAIHVEMEALSLDEILRDVDPEWGTPEQGQIPDSVKDSYEENSPKVILYKGPIADDEVANDSIYEIVQSQELKLNAVVKPNSASQIVNWTVTGDTAAVSIAGDGTVTGLKPGTVTITATAANGKTAGVTVKVGANTLTYSEGALILGSENIDGNAYTETLNTSKTINLTSPVGASTERYFTTSAVMDATEWTIADENGDPTTVALTAVGTDGKTYKVSIPVGFEGDAVLKVGGMYEITFHVTNGVALSSSLNAGETFAADGIEWRVLMKNGGEALVIAEHVLSSRIFYHTWPYPKWSGSDIRTYLNDSTTGFLSTLNELSPIDKAIITRTERYGTGGTHNETTNDKVFLLSLEEAFYAGTDNVIVAGTGRTGIAGVRTNGDTVIFANRFARRSSYVGNGSVSFWWLRSPDYSAMSDGQNIATVLTITGGDISNRYIEQATGVRPALWLDIS